MSHNDSSFPLFFIKNEREFFSRRDAKDEIDLFEWYKSLLRVHINVDFQY